MALTGLDAQAAKIVDPSTDINVKLAIIRDMGRVLLEAPRDHEFARAINAVFPILIDTLKTGSPVTKRLINDKENPEQVLRVQTLEVIHKFTTSEFIRPHLDTLIPLLFDIIRTDNEEMGVLATKMFNEIVRTVRPLVESHIPTFITLSMELYNRSPELVEDLFGPSGPAMVDPDRAVFTKAFPSCKLIQDTALLLTFIFQATAPPLTQQNQNQNQNPNPPPHFPKLETVFEAATKVYLLETPQEGEKDADLMDEGIQTYGPPPSIVNKSVFIDFLSAQIRVGHFLGLVCIRYPIISKFASWPQWSAAIPPAALRMLRLTPPDGYIVRREAVSAMRYLAQSELKTTLADVAPALTDERLFVGNLKSEPQLFVMLHNSMAEIFAQTRPYMNIQSYLPFLKRCATLLSDTTVPPSTATIGTKVMLGVMDALVAKFRGMETPYPSDVTFKGNTILFALLESVASRLEASVIIIQKLLVLKEGNAGDDLKQLVTLEQSRTVPMLSYLASDNLDLVLNEEKWFLRASPLLIRQCLQLIRTMAGRVPAADSMSRIFKSICQGLSLVKGDAQDLNSYKGLVDIFAEMEPHVFQEVWSTNMEAYFELVSANPALLNIVEQVLKQGSTATLSLVALLLRHVVDNLESLLETNRDARAIVVRLLKNTFAAVANLQDGAERVIFPHLPRLLVDIFPLAARSSDPRNVLSVPFWLFRALGQKAQSAKFESLHKEVVPLLPELLDGVNRSLDLTDDPNQKEQLVEIALTVPARLQYLAPFITQLWRSLVLSLGSKSPELLRQGLRTLELAVDNLSNIDLLDPTNEPVARELVLALHRTLKPGPAYADTAQTASRILGKIGGRNRRILAIPPSLPYEPSVIPVSIPIEFTSHPATLEVTPACEVAIKVLKDGRGNIHYESAFSLLRTQILFLLQKGIDDRSSEDLFIKVLDGLVSAIHLSNMEPAANELLRDVARALFEMELAKDMVIQPSRRSILSPVTGIFLDSVVTVLVQRQGGNHTNAKRFIANLIQDLHDRSQSGDRDRIRNTSTMVTQFFSKFVTLCWHPDWRYKVAACAGISVLISDEVSLGSAWPYHKEVELVRSLLMILKDMPTDPPAEVPDVISTLLDLIRFCNSPDRMSIDPAPLDDNARKEMSHEELQHYDWVHKPLAKKAEIYAAIFQSDLNNSNKTVRDITHSVLNLISEISGVRLADALKEVLPVLTKNIYLKPLRMFNPPTQIGFMDAMTFLLNIDPPVIEATDELWRLLNEVIVLGEADDQVPPMLPMNPMQRLNRRMALLTAKTKAASIRLLTASLGVTDYFSKQPVIRQRATTLLFKALYSATPEIKDAAHDGLKIFLRNQSRLPREHLQAGLRPVLMNLADASKLTVASLEGLARLLSLLTNYFKVEIATKLIDHFKTLATDDMLREAAYGPMNDNDTINKLVRLLDIFHLLPPAANTYLEQVVELVVITESKLHATSPTPFTPPVSAYVDRFSVDGLTILFGHIKEVRWVQTFRHIIRGEKAPKFVKELKERGHQIAQTIEKSEHGHAGVPCILLCQDLAELDPEWMAAQGDVLDALKDVWNVLFTSTADDTSFTSARLLLIRAIYSIWICVFKIKPRVDILFSISLIFTRPTEISYLEVIDFISAYAANNTSVSFKHESVQFFLEKLDENAPSDDQLLQYLRVVIIPLLTAEFKQADSPEEVVSDGLINKIWEKVWSVGPTAEWSPAFTTELLQLTGILVQNAFSRIGMDIPSGRGSLAKYIWELLKAPEAVVRNTASLTAARFFSNKEVASDKFQGTLWSGLLKAPQDGETSSIARQALDIMTPVMTRLPAAEMTLKWDALICRTLAEEQNNISTIVNIYRLILRHSDQCYQSREVFIPQFVQGLTKLSFNPSSTLEIRNLFHDLIDLVFDWQRRACEDVKSAMVVDSIPTASRWVMPIQMKEAVSNILIRFALNSSETTKPGLNIRSLLQLKALFGSEDWSDVPVKLSSFNRILELPENVNSQGIAQLVNNVKVLSIIAVEQHPSWYNENAAELFSFARRAMSAPQDDIVDSFAPVFDRLLKALPVGDEGTEPTGLAADVYQWLSESVRDSLSNGTKTLATLHMLLSLAKTAPSRIEPYAAGLMKLYSKCIKDYLTPPPGTPADHIALAAQRIYSVLDISRLSVAYFNDQRKQFLTGLVNLVTASASPDMRRRLLSLTRDWVLESPTTIPTAKEKASLISKMQGWIKYGDAVYRDYLNLVYDVYTAPFLVRSDLTVRLESSFVLGCRVDDMELRTRFLDLFSNHVPKIVGSRLAYLLGGQSWESMSDFNWAFVILDMLLGATNGEAVVSPMESALSTLAPTTIRVQDFIQPMRNLLFFDPSAMHKTFVTFFPEVWRGLSRKEQADITASTVHVLTRDVRHEMAQPNIFQSLLGGIRRCNPSMALPPHLIKYLVKIYHAWYDGLEILQNAVEQGREDDATIREANQDALAEIYAELCEDDYYYGLWRRRCLYEETNAGLAYEQNGFYHFAQPLYELAQLKTRQNVHPMSETEYYVWEDHWMLCAEKLLQWDVLADVASGEGNPDLALECAWRKLETWNQENVSVATFMNQMQDPATPRRQLFKAYFTLNTMASTAREQFSIDPGSEFAKITDEANQLSLRKWATLPEHLTAAHVPILAQFQQIVELKEAGVLMGLLIQTTRENLNEKAHEAKNILAHWRDRLPLPHDDIGLWNDLIAWRQHVFHAVNKFYLPLLPEQSAQSTASTHAHRGHHESAWIINRFAHVARKHGLLQVCQSSLADIYKLPNIEISEAFLKLREQARCHFEKVPPELYQGLEVINNTNLMYFSAAQKAEFFAMKGLFLHQLGRNEEANSAFAQAVQLDFSMPKAWHLWGVYSDGMHTSHPTDFSYAANALSCYLQAASLYKSAKCRPLLNRVLWLLSMDDQHHNVGRMWDAYKGEHIYWYWVTLIPQLLTSLSQRESRYAHQVLYNIAKTFPQALHYQLRTLRDDFIGARKEHLQRLHVAAQGEAAANPPAADGSSQPTTGDTVPQPPVQDGSAPLAPPEGVKYPWDMADELINLLKTGHPLLALTLEQLAEALRERLKPTDEEIAYRATGALLSEAMQWWVQMTSNATKDTSVVPAQLHMNAQKLVPLIPHGRLRNEYEARIAKSERPMTLLEFLRFVIYFRDQSELVLDRRPRTYSVDTVSHYLAEFHIARFEKVHVLGQWQEHKDPTSHFVEIKRVSGRAERCRTLAGVFRRFTFLGHDGSTHAFLIQFNHSRVNTRREERFMQLVRVFNETLMGKKEARKRNLEFHLLSSVSLHASLRLLKMDSSYVSLIEIHDEYCKERGFGREEPLLCYQERLRAYTRSKGDMLVGNDLVPGMEGTKQEFWQVRMDAKNEVEAKYIPKTVLSNYMKRTMKDSWALWTMRKQFTLQMAATSFLIWVTFLRLGPNRYFVSRETGLMGLMEASPALRQDRPALLYHEQQTPFRLTPNIQDFITPIGIEGLLTSGMLALARGLLEPHPEDLEKQMWLLLRDDFQAWYKAQGRPHPSAENMLEFRMSLAQAIEKIVGRMGSMTGEGERKKAQASEGTTQLPTTTVCVGIQQLINNSTNPALTTRSFDVSYPWF